MYSPSGILNSYIPSSALSKFGEVILYIVRHANVALDSKDRIRGLENPSLDAEGRQQAQSTAEYFKDIPISAIYTDDLNRTRETAEIIAEAKGLPVQTDIRLRSWDVGSDLEGQPIEDHEDYIKQLKQNPSQVPVGGQSWGDFEDQVESSFRDHVADAWSASAPIILLTHGSAIQIIMASIKNQENNEEDYDEIPVEPSGVIAVSLSRNGLTASVKKGEKENEDE